MRCRFWVWLPLVVCIVFAAADITEHGAGSKHANLFKEEMANLEFSFEETKLLEVIGSFIGISVGEITSIMNLVKIGLGVAEMLETIFVKVFNGTSFELPDLIKPGMDRQLLAMYEIVTLRLEQIQRGTEGTATSLRALARGLPSLVRWEIALDTLEGYTKPINNLYHRFSYYQKFKNTVENHTLLDFAESVVSHSTTSIQALLASTHSMIAPSDPPVLRGMPVLDREEYEVYNSVSSQMSLNYKRLLRAHPDYKKEKLQEMSLRQNLFRMLEDAVKNYDHCDMNQSPQQLAFGLYTLLAVTLARGYAMVSFSYNILRINKKGNFTVEQKLSDELYTHYSRGLYRNAYEVIQRLSNSYKTCDPLEHVENKTFVMVTELLQGYIENEVDLNSRSTCSGKCSNYEHIEVQGCYLPDKQYCGKHRRCKGQVHDCKFFDADATVCISSVPYRRYDWIRYENQKLLGRENYCPNLMKVDSWWRFLYHCSYCVCLCDDPFSSASDRFISLRPVVSDIAEGMVVTGLKFTKNNRVLHVQIQQGKATPQGQVDPETVRWVDVDPISVGTSKFRENEDYFMFKYESRSVDLDHLRAPKGHVVTGLKFRTLGSHVNLEMWVTPINFTSGQLQPEQSFWISNDNTPVMASSPRKKVELIEPDDPRRSPSESVVDSHSDMYVTLGPTSLSADVSQLTVPFFDAQTVAPNPPSWMEGVQLYHRGREGYGGFIAFKLFNYNLIKNVNEDFNSTPFL